MQLVARTLLAAGLLAGRAGAAVHLVQPVDGEAVRGSAVTVALALDREGDATGLRLELNGRDVAARLRGAGLERTFVLAGAPGRGNPLRIGRNGLAVTSRDGVVKSRFTWQPRVERVRVVVVGNRLDFHAYESFATWQAELDRIFESLVRPALAPGRPNVVLLTEDFGLPTGLLGSRGATTRAAENQGPLAALTNLFVAYADQAAYYTDHFALPGTGIQPAARALVLALTDTLWRSFVPTLATKAAALGVYLVACTNVAPAHRSIDPDAVAFFGDVDDPARTDVFLPDGIDVYNTAFLWGPDGALVGTTRKVFLTAPEENLLNLTPGRLDDVVVFDTAAGRIGIAISLDAFIEAYVQRLDDLGATLVLQPDANPGLWATPPGAVWQPDEWTGSVLGMLRADLPNLAYNATSMMTGNFFPGRLGPDGVPTGILFDGQSSVTRRSGRPPRSLFVGMAPGRTLTILGVPLRGEFVAVSPWAFPDPVRLPSARDLEALRRRCASEAGAGAAPGALTLAERRQLLYDCARTLLPGAPNAGAYRESVVTADLVMPISG